MSNIDERIETFKSVIKPIGYELFSKPEGELIRHLTDDGYFTAPASTKFHGAYEGGLFDHSVNVTDTLVKLTKECDLKWERPASPIVIGMFHDICKCDAYRHPFPEDCIVDSTGFRVYTVNKSSWEHNPDQFIKGHGDKSVMLLSEYLTLTREEIACIRYHMGAFTDKSEWNNYTNAIHHYPNVLWTHHADMIAAHCIEMGKGS